MPQLAGVTIVNNGFMMFVINLAPGGSATGINVSPGGTVIGTQNNFAAPLADGPSRAFGRRF